MDIGKASEDYLEAMIIMEERHGFIRSVDIADFLGVTKPSVSYATKRLREGGFISMDKAGHITLEPPGREIAERIFRRHKVLTDMLIGFGIDAETARADACKIEHDISDKTFAAILKHVEGQRS